MVHSKKNSKLIDRKNNKVMFTFNITNLFLDS